MSLLKVGNSHAHFKDLYGELGSLKLIKDCGFECVDYSLHCYQDFSVQDYTKFSSDYIFYQPDSEIKKHFVEVKKYMDDIGLIAEHTHAPFYYFAPAECFNNKDFVSLFLKAIDASMYLGAKQIVIHPPQCSDPENNYKRLFDIAYKYYGQLQQRAIDDGVEIAIENLGCYDVLKGKIGMPSTFSSAEKLLNIINALGKGFCACLDTGHAYFAGQDPAHFARLLGDKLKVLHLQDTDGYNDLHICPTCGYINWDDFIHALVDINYNGVLNFEVNFHRSGDKNMFAYGQFLSVIGHNWAEDIENIKRKRSGKKI